MMSTVSIGGLDLVDRSHFYTGHGSVYEVARECWPPWLSRTGQHGWPRCLFFLLAFDAAVNKGKLRLRKRTTFVEPVDLPHA